MKPITAKEYLDLKNNHQVLLVDVRELHEVEAKRITGSLHIALHDLPNHIFALKDKDSVVIHCRSGGRAKEAAKFLEDHGIKNVYYMITFIDDWEKEGLKVQTEKKKRFTIENLIMFYLGLGIFISTLIGIYHKAWLIFPLVISCLLIVNSILKRSIFQYFKRQK